MEFDFDISKESLEARDIWRATLAGDCDWERDRRRFRLIPGGQRCKNCHAPLTGLGAQVRTYGSRFEIDKLFGILLVVLAVGLVGSSLLMLLDRRVTRGARLAVAHG